MAERALEAHVKRILDPSRKAFGKLLAEHGVQIDNVAQSRIDIEQARQLVFSAAAMIDTVGAKEAKKQLAIAKVAVPRACLKVIDRSIQAHGAAGVSQDFNLAEAYASMRTLRLADGPDEVHLHQIGRMEISKSKL